MGVVVSGSASARVGLAGNPSDGYGGAVLAVPMPDRRAVVVLTPGRPAAVSPPAPLVTATVARLRRWSGVVDEEPFSLQWRTTIPRSVGLGGSSAIVIATIRALAAHWSLDIDPTVVAALALAVETEDLGFAAGIQDRVVQAHECAVLVDCSNWQARDGVEVPAVKVLRPGAPIEVYVAWLDAAASPSHRYHATLRARFAAGDARLVRAMANLAAIARTAASALEAGRLAELAAAIDASYDVRRTVAPMSAAHEELIGAARAAGLPATSAGSGGSVTGVVTEDAQLDRLRAAVDGVRVRGWTVR